MASEELKNRAESLVANAHGTEIESHDLFTLADDSSSLVDVIKNKTTKYSGSSAPRRGFLADQPIINYFDQGEQPHYLIYNEGIGVSIGDSRKKSDIEGRNQNTMWVTDQGIHFAIGRSDGDFHKFVPFHTLENIEKDGDSLTSMKPYTFIFYTEEGDNIEFSVDSGLDKKEAFDFIDQQIRKSSSPKDDVSTRSSTTTRKKSVQSGEGTSGTELFILQEVDEHEFEHIVSKVWEQQGWETEVTDKSGDRGIDIKAEKEDPFQQLQYIQAKRYSASNKVGSSEIQRYAGLHAREETVDAVVVATTSEFTAEAEKVARNRNVKIIDGTQLVEMIDEYDIEI